jgi:Family of unknown function (DUF5994)
MAPVSISDTSTIPPTSAADTAPAEQRLSLDSALSRRGAVDGGWWPHSRDAQAELPALVAALSARLGHISRVALPAAAFGNIPHRLGAGGGNVKVGWFNSMNIDTISLTIAGRDDIVLLVIPPQSSPAAAAAALTMAALGRGAAQPAAILAAAGITAGGATAAAACSGGATIQQSPR